ncbi:MAG TPA: hypothetical protein VF233_04030 [Nitrososphaeraceae archaeon]|jgi:hypothetical protein
MSDDDVNKTYLKTFRIYIKTRYPSPTVKEASKATGDWVGVIEAKKRMIDWVNRINFKAQVT